MEFSTRIKEWANSVYFAFLLFIVSICGVFITLIYTSPAGLGATGMLFAFSIFYFFFFSLFLFLFHILQLAFIRAQVRVDNNEPQITNRQMQIGKVYGIS